ncbi:hypothetical protein [Shinella pollutisoli]|uniref:Uncharacterized protein n=1 Tax=Shinella pollutisoli TaxID=2250594 RepID=A0ABV7DPM8_9HYPH|nr:hypothetical protein [Shinella pollutisoli]
MSVLRRHLETLPRYQREELVENRWGEGEKLASQLGTSWDLLRSILREIERATAASQQGILRHWHEAVLIHQSLSATEKVAALRVWSFVNHKHLYAWPSQDRIARELGYSRGPNLGKALKRAFEIGAYTPVRVKNLPPEIRDQAVHGSRRSLRGIAYRLNPVESWEQEAASFVELQNSNMFHGGTLEGSMAHHLNYEVNRQPASPDSFAHAHEVNQRTFPLVETSQYGTDGGRTHG